MEEGFGQASIKTFVLEVGSFSGLVRGAMFDLLCSLAESFWFVAFVTSGTLGFSFDIKNRCDIRGFT